MQWRRRQRHQKSHAAVRPIERILKSTHFNLAEFLRFLASGCIATVANISAVALSRQLVSIYSALIFGVTTGFVVSFLLSKFFAFKSPSWSESRTETVRFFIVYAAGAVVYWCIGAVSAGPLTQLGFSRSRAELLAALAGAGVMMVTSYLGHRLFTYRTHRTDGAA